jgi:hypothetical protein
MFPFDPFPPIDNFVDTVSLEPSLSNIAPWVRLLLTGSVSSETPSDEDLVFFLTSTVALFTSRYPCLDPLTAALSAADLEAYNEAAACQIAARYVLTSTGQKWAQVVIESKQGSVDLKYSSGGGTVAQASQLLKNESSMVLRRISCVKAGLPKASIFGTSGVRTTPLSAIEDAYGPQETT